jgi:N-formylglutamate amidohydrolase
MSETAPFSLIEPARQSVPVVLTSPHSGRRYGAAFLAASRLDAVAIRRSEDSFVEELFAAGPALGLPLLAAEFPRAWCDANREAWELDPAMFEDALPDFVDTRSPRVRAGLGTIARVVGNGEPIYAGKLKFAEAKTRVEACWEPFHAALDGLIARTLARFGSCLVIDCHSMPSVVGRQAGRADIVLGDAYGNACLPGWMNFFEASFTGMGLRVRRNDPYAGGYITRHYGRPRDGVQVVQVEVARGLYMNERNFTRNAQFEATRESMTEFLAAVVEASALWGLEGPPPRAAAAE